MMTYNLRNRNLLNTRVSFLGSSSSDGDSHSSDSSDSDPDFVRPTRGPRRPDRNNARLSGAIQRSAGIRISDSGGPSSRRRTTGTVERRRPGQHSNSRANGEEDRQRPTERHRKKKKTKISEPPKVEISKRTVLSWLISSGIVEENKVVWYVDAKSGNRLGEGKVNRKGILCNCCSRQITVGEFEIHSGCKTGKPYQHIFLAGSQHSLLDCQIKAWQSKEEEEKRRFNNFQPEPKAVDRNDDACIICADGGDLVCCEKCPSAFHPNCIFMEAIPPGDWLCSYCVCKFCGSGDGVLKRCTQCEKQYHCTCGGEKLDLMSSPASLCCGNSCRKIYEGLQSMVGVRNDLHDGLSWTLLQRTEIDPHADNEYNKVESNSKIAVAWPVMNECFFSVIDRHTRSNIVQSIVYSRGSNVTRVNYSGFYTAVLEKNDEIISGATIRVHGKGLAEMPFIGTRAQYRSQGMAGVLENCIESALRALHVEKLMIPSLDYLVHMWTQRHFFSRIEELRLMKDLCQYNTVMFPRSVVKLQKNLAALPDLNMGPSEANEAS